MNRSKTIFTYSGSITRSIPKPFHHLARPLSAASGYFYVDTALFVLTPAGPRHRDTSRPTPWLPAVSQKNGIQGRESWMMKDKHYG